MTMTKTATRFERRQQVMDYIEKYNPYETSNLGYDVAAMCRYAKQKGVKVAELTKDEAELFKK